MAELVLFHHVLGLTPGIIALADRLRAGGHTVHTPDMYEGERFATLDEGMAHVRSVGFAEVSARGVEAVEGLGPDLVYAGYSLGVMPAQQLAQTRAGARGALLIAACMPTDEFGGRWPAGVPLQVHAQEHDPEFDNGYDLPTAQAVVAEAADGELFLYPGDKHFFADSSTAEYDAEATGLLVAHALALLARV
jgi:dienelactone hydrolase